jgi:hypothetical protein
MFTCYDILLDNEASLNVFRDKNLLTNIGVSTSPVTMRGIEKQGKEVNVMLEGTFGDIGQVYYSDNASANILSSASLVDQG